MSSRVCDHQLGVEVSAAFALLVLISEDSCGTGGVGRECLPDMSVGQWQGAVPMYVLVLSIQSYAFCSVRKQACCHTLNTHGARSSLPMCLAVS